MKTQEREIKEDIAVIFDVSHYNLQYTPAFIGKILSGVYKNWDMGLYTQYLKRFDLPKDKRLKVLQRNEDEIGVCDRIQSCAEAVDLR